DLDAAARFYARAVERLPLPELAVAYGESLQAAGRTEEAARQWALVRAVAQLQRANGVAVDFELASFFADHGGEAERSAAAERALEEYRTRPTVKAAESAAWALHRAGRSAEALPLARESTRLDTADPRLLFPAGPGALAAAQP